MKSKLQIYVLKVGAFTGAFGLPLMIVGTKQQMKRMKKQISSSSFIQVHKNSILTYTCVDDTQSSHSVDTKSGINNSAVIIAWSHFTSTRRMIDRKCKLLIDGDVFFSNMLTLKLYLIED